jgi:hypothetical protein
MQQRLENDCLVAGLAHVPNATGTTAGTRVLDGVVLDVGLGGPVFGPLSLAIYRMSVFFLPMYTVLIALL